MSEKFKAFILMNIGIAHIKKVSAKLLEFKELENIHELYGQYDVIVKLVTENRVKAEEFIEKEIRQNPAIGGTETLVVSETIKEGDNETTGLNEAEVYILFTVKYGKEEDVSQKLAGFDEVERVHILYGQYDLIAKIKCKTNRGLEDFIQKNIRSMKDVETTETLVVSDVP